MRGVSASIGVPANMMQLARNGLHITLYREGNKKFWEEIIAYFP
jgi:hypothetical protein